MERHCNFCSGSSNFRKDKVLENLYHAVKDDVESIPALVSSKPCSALKMILAFHDENLINEFISQYSGKEAQLPACPIRMELSRKVSGVQRDLGNSLTLGNLVQILSSTLDYAGNVGMGIKKEDELETSEAESYDFHTSQGISLAGRFAYLYQEEPAHQFRISRQP